jgi:hypothetical protein
MRDALTAIERGNGSLDALNLPLGYVEVLVNSFGGF